MSRKGTGLILVISGIVAAIVAAEIILRCTGSLYYDRRLKAEQEVIRQDNESALGVSETFPGNNDGDDVIRIVCVGDSHTFGMGAEPGYSYPAQLQKLLNERESRPCRVYNCGVPGLTAIKLRQRLPGILETYRPQIIVFLIGQNDTNYPFVSDLYEISGYYRTSIVNRIEDVIAGLRIYKLGEYVVGGLKKRLAKSRMRDADSSPPNVLDDYLYKANVAFKEGNIPMAEKYFQLAEQSDPANEGIYMQKAHYYHSLDRFDECLRECEKVIELNPYSEHRRDVYRQLFLLYQQLNRSGKYRDKIRRIAARIPSDDRFQTPGDPFSLTDSMTTFIFQKNADQMINLSRANRAIPIIQTYPRVGHFISAELRKISARHGLKLVDNEINFYRLKDLLSYFAPGGGHPNRHGYRLVAEEVFKKVEEVIRENYEESGRSQ